VAEALLRDGFEVASYRPQVLAESDVASAARVVTIGLDPATLPVAPSGRLERWDDVPPVSAGYTAARAKLLSRIEALLGTFEREMQQP
jgi:hypothetical protein